MVRVRSGGIAGVMVALAGVALAGSVARAQERVTYAFSFQEVNAFTNAPIATPNGLIDIGEGARIVLTTTFTPVVGSTTTYPAPPPPGTGTVAGLSTIFFDLFGANNAQGTWSFMQRAGGWELGGGGTPTASGSAIQAAQAGQFIAPGQAPNQMNPVTGIWSATWVPDVFSARTVTFSSFAPAAAGNGQHSSLLVRYGTDGSGNPLYVSKFVAADWGRVSIPIAVPAPGGLALMAMAALGVARRRRVS